MIWELHLKTVTEKNTNGYITVNDDGDLDRCTLTLWRMGEVGTQRYNFHKLTVPMVFG